MAKFSSVEEILRFAIARELEANQIYREFAEMAHNPGMRSLFEALARDEDEHRETLELELMKRGTVAKKINLSDYAVRGELRAGMDYKEALLIAMDKERASFRLYFDLACQTENAEQREAFMSLAEEEAKHKLLFELEYEALMARKSQTE